MTTPAFTVNSHPHHEADTVVVVGLFKTGETTALRAHSDMDSVLESALDVEAGTGAESFTRVSRANNRPCAVIGLGSTPKTLNTLRDAAGVAVRRLAGHDCVEFALDFETEEEVIAVLEGALFGAYSFTRYRHSTLADSRTVVQNIHIRTALAVSDSDLARVREKASAMALVKDLVNTPANDLYPESFATIATEIAELSPDLHVSVWDEALLAEEGFGGILGVGQGSERGPRLVKFDYNPQGAKKHVALVGKGITFDTGGLSLKSGPGMMGMKYDMTGAATALAVVGAVSNLHIPVHVTAWLCLAENMPSGHATRPNDILRIRGGKTVEVLNTDAEGRLVLADGLTAASEEHPDLIIDIATLTGAATTALGTRTVGVMGNTQMISHLVEVATSSGETFWHMPLPAELRPLLNSDVADIANVKPGNTAGGMLIAGVFLRDFVGFRPSDGEGEKTQIDWIHLDIAGTANNGGSAYGFTSGGPTGVTVRALIDYIEAQ